MLPDFHILPNMSWIMDELPTPIVRAPLTIVYQSNTQYIFYSHFRLPQNREIKLEWEKDKFKDSMNVSTLFLLLDLSALMERECHRDCYWSAINLLLFLYRYLLKNVKVLFRVFGDSPFSVCFHGCKHWQHTMW